MAKKRIAKAPQTETEPQRQVVPWNQGMSMRALLAANSSSTMARDAFLRRFQVRDVDMNYECRWPTRIDPADYKSLFERNSVAGRVVTVWPNECWILPPEIYDVEDQDTETAAEKEWKVLNKNLALLSELFILDILSGIGRYGLLVFGLSDLQDNETFKKPVEGFDLTTGEVTSPLKLELLYTRVYQEADVEIVQWDQDRNHKRYGQPVLYRVQMEDPASGTIRTEEVHFTRVLHQVDNRLSSRVFGEPRMKPVYNDIIDAMKVKGGSSEGYWRACLSGIVWGLDPSLMDPNAVIDTDTKDEMKDDFEKMWNSMQRFMFSEGLIPHDVAPHLVDPTPYLDNLLKLICIRINVPMPIFVGREEGKLAAPDQWKGWIDRVIGRQNNYLTPCMIQPFLRRLQMYGVLPWTEEELMVDWPDRNAPTDSQIAETADKVTTALAKYVQGGVNQLVGEREFLGQVMKKSQDEIEAISDEVEEWERLNSPPEDNMGEGMENPNDGRSEGQNV